MRAFVVFLSFLAMGVAFTAYAKPVEMGVSAVVVEELPWETVDAVLHRAAEVYHSYSYSQLVEWYSDELLTVEVQGSGYLVTIYDEDGILDVLEVVMY